MQILEAPAGFSSFCHALEVPGMSQHAIMLMHPLEVFNWLPQSSRATALSGGFACLRLHISSDHEWSRSSMAIEELRGPQFFKYGKRCETFLCSHDAGSPECCHHLHHPCSFCTLHTQQFLHFCCCVYNALKLHCDADYGRAQDRLHHTAVC